MKERKEGVAIGGWDWAELANVAEEVVCGVEIGRIGGETDDIFKLDMPFGSGRARERSVRFNMEGSEYSVGEGERERANER